MSIHLTRAPTVPLTSYDTKRSSHLNEKFAVALARVEFIMLIPSFTYKIIHLWRGKIYPLHWKNLTWLNWPVWQVGLCPWGKSRMARDRTSSPPESTRKTNHSLPALTLPVPSVPYDTMTAAPEDSSAGDEAQPAKIMSYDVKGH